MDNRDIMLNDIFTNNFDEIKFNKFIINLLNLEQEDRLNSTPTKERSRIYENHIEYVKNLGKYKDENKSTIIASIVKLKGSVDKGRTLQRNYIAKHLKDTGSDAAIVALYSDNSDTWRISFVKLDTTFDINKLTGNLEIKEEITPAKRYSYLVEKNLKNHTVQRQLRTLLFNDVKKPSVEEIEKVFSVEVVTDEFFKMYKEKYLDLKEFLEKNDEFIQESKRLLLEVNEFSEEFAKKLMGQVAFLYFLQKKGWLGVKIVPKVIERTKLREFYKKQNEETRSIITNVYKPKEEYMVLDSNEINNLSDNEADLLASVFKNSDYDKEWGSGTKTFIRDVFEVSKKNNKNFFNYYLEPLFYNALNKKRGNDEYYKKFNCKIPFLNGGLFEPIYKYEWENVTIEISNEFFSNDDNNGLLDFFDMYNFTMNEDEPLEKEVAVDPEMLGKIFENLLDVKERKSKGAFYTPREIVHYMCQECLINYLHNETNIDTTSLEVFIKYGDIIKDADLNIKYKKDYKMPKYIIDNLEVIDKALETVTVADPSVGSGAFPLGMLNEIVRARSILVEYMTKDFDEWSKEDFIRDNKKSLYDLKKNAMKKSIFAVDIEPSAVDITKLRLWLSLVVDADVRTINTLPNLDYNIMVGNSLIDEFNGIKLFDEELLNTKPKINKKEISNQISMNIEGTSANIGIEQEHQLLEDIQVLQGKLFDEKETIEKKRIKKEIEDKEWELIEYKLNRDKGLSYGEIQEFKKLKKSNRRPYFLWKLEFSRIFKQKGGFDIVIGNPPYVSAVNDSKGNLANREYIRKRYKLIKGAFDLYAVFLEKCFELSNSNNIYSWIIPNKLLVSKYAEDLLVYMKETSMYKIVNVSDFGVFKNVGVYPIMVFGDSKNSSFTEYNVKSFEQLESNKLDIKKELKEYKTFKDYGIKFASGATGFQAKIIKEYLSEESKVDNIPFIVSGAVDPYRVDYENIRYMKSLYTRAYVAQGEGIANSKWEFWNNEKIVIAGMTKRIEAVYIKEPTGLGVGIYAIHEYGKYRPEVLLALLNSKFLSYYLNIKFKDKHLAGGYLAINKSTLEQLPLVNICEEDQAYIYELVKEFDLNKDNKSHIKCILDKIDKKVYEIYGVDDSTIKLVDEFFNKMK